MLFHLIAFTFLLLSEPVVNTRTYKYHIYTYEYSKCTSVATKGSTVGMISYLGLLKVGCPVDSLLKIFMENWDMYDIATARRRAAASCLFISSFFLLYEWNFLQIATVLENISRKIPLSIICEGFCRFGRADAKRLTFNFVETLSEYIII